MKITKKEKKEIIKASSIFQDWPNSLLFQIYPLFTQVDFPRKTQIYQQEMMNEYLYIIVSGEVELAKYVNKVTKPLIILSKGQCFGDYEVKKELTHRLINATAKSDCTLLCCPITLFIEILSQNQKLYRTFHNSQKILIEMQLATLNPVSEQPSLRTLLKVPQLYLNLNKPSEKLLQLFKEKQDAFMNNLNSKTKRSLNNLNNINSPHQSQIQVPRRTSRMSSLYQSLVTKPQEQQNIQLHTLTQRQSIRPLTQIFKQNEENKTIVDFIPRLRMRRSQTQLRINP